MSNLRSEVKALTALATPVVAAQLGMMLFGIVDIWMVGRLGSDELAAVALADVCLFGSLILGIGFVMGIDPLVTQAHGAGDGARVGRALQHGIVVALLAAVPLTFVWLHVGDLLVLFGQDPVLARWAQVYADMQIFAVAPFLGFVALRHYLQGRGLMTPPLWIILGANLLNAALNEVLIFGRFGAPELGLAGAGLATGITQVCMCAGLALLVSARGLHRGAWTPWTRAAWRDLGPVLGYGTAIAIQLGLEVWAFSASTVVAGWLGPTATAAHVVVLKLAALAFMVPLGLSIAAATRVGNRIGAGDRPGAQRAAWVSLGLCACAMCVSAFVFVVFRANLGRLFTADEAVVGLAAAVFPVAGAFQIFDGTQAVGGGILRGMGTPRPAAVFNLVGYYALALPIGYALAIPGGWGLPGVWWGLCAGLAVVASGLVLYVRYRGPQRTPNTRS